MNAGVFNKEKVRLLLEGAFTHLSSTAIVNREVGRALVRRNRLAFGALPIEKNDAFPKKGSFQCSPWLEAAAKPFTGLADVHVWHQWPPSAARPDAGRWVLFQGWEYGSLPKEIVALFRTGPDELWTYSSHCARGFEADGIPKNKIRIIPLGVDPARFHPGVKPLESIASPLRGKTVFLFVGGTIWRKGIDLVLSAYCRAFTRKDPVVLVIKEMGSDTFYQNFNLTEAVERLAGSSLAPEILLLKEEIEDTHMPALYGAGTCLVHPYRGEGFGLPVLEALACGLPVIVTAGGACDDFLPEVGAYPIPAKRRRIPLPFETARPAWILEPDRQALVDALRAVANDKEGARQRVLKAGEEIRKTWTWDRTAARIETRCAALSGGILANAHSSP